MNNKITPELRSQILLSIKDGVSSAEAAEKYGVTQRTIQKWIRSSAGNSHSNSSELTKAKKEIEFLKSVILELTLEKYFLNRKG